MAKFKFKLKPLSLTIWTDCCVPKNFAGCNKYFVNFIRPKYIDDKGLYAHELTHTQQFWRNPFKYWFWTVVRSFPYVPKELKEWMQDTTFSYECEAYGRQLLYANPKYLDKVLDLFAKRVITYYDVGNRTFDEAKNLIRKHYERFLAEPRIV